MSASTPAAQTPSATAPTAPSSGPALTFLGTGAGCGVPAFFCECPACEEARRDPRARRGDCGVLVRNERTLLLDTPPDLRRQLEREGVRAVDRVLWTHAHFDRSGGPRRAGVHGQAGHGSPASLRGEPCGARGHPRRVPLPGRHPRFPAVAPFDEFAFDDVRYKIALPVTHAPGTYGGAEESCRCLCVNLSNT